MLAADRGYASLLRLRGARPLFLWASLARLQYGALPVALLLLLAEARDSFADAGAAVAAYGLAAGLLGPMRARFADRFGAARTLVALGVSFAVALLGLVTVAGGPLLATIALSALAGCTPPPVGPLMRSEWRRMTSADLSMLRRAYSLDAVSEEVLFVLGPLLVAGTAAWLGPSTAALGSASVLVASSIGMAGALPHDVSPLAGTPAARSTQPLALWRDLDFLAGLAPAAGLGLLLGGVQVASLAAAVLSEQSSVAGLPIAAVSAGSVLGGLIFGRRAWPGSSSQQARLLAVTTAGLVVFAASVAGHFSALVAILAVAGLFIAPAVVCSYLIADEAGPPGASEPTAWVNAAFNASVAVGAGTSGVLVDMASPAWALATVACASGSLVVAPGLLVALLRRRPVISALEDASPGGC